VITNPPGQDAIAYRVADFAGFRAALLAGLPGEQELTSFAPAAGDLGLQVLEWWAYLGDILTFYNERIASEAYLRTATRPDSLDHLVRVLGYRPRPGIAATGTLAVLARPGGVAGPLAVPAGLAITSTPSPGVPAQTFETTAAGSFSGPSDIPVTLVPPAGMTAGSVLLAGTVTGVKTGDSLLLIPQGWDGTTETWAVVTVQGTAPAADPSGGTNTLVSFGVSAGADPASAPGSPGAASYRLLRPISSVPLLQPITQAEVADLSFDLTATVRGITPGDIVMIDGSGNGSGSYPAVVTGYSEATWYSVNGAAATAAFPAANAAATSPPVVVPLPHSVLDLSMPPSAASALAAWMAPIFAAEAETATVDQTVFTALDVTIGGNTAQAAGGFTGTGFTDAGFGLTDTRFTDTGLADVGFSGIGRTFGWFRIPVPPQILRYTFTDVGTSIPVPVPALASLPATATVPDGFQAPVAAAAAFVQDSTGAGAGVTITAAGAGQITLGPPAGGGTAVSPALVPPLRLLLDLVEVTRGTSVPGEILGSGDASTGGQAFALAKSPLTYLAAGDGQASTLTVSVAGIAWTEVSTLFMQPPGARVFVTRQLSDGSTQVRFGDGVNGARLPTGTGNVVASYRYGSGAASPPAGTLTSVAQPQPGLAGVRNPVPVAGGADPDLPSALRRNGPASTLTLGRAVSAADYEAVAVRTPGVDRARAVWAFSPAEQRPVITVYAGDTQAAAGLARAALAASGDPNRPVTVTAASPIRLQLGGTLVVAAGWSVVAVAAAAAAALLDPDTGLFSPAGMAIGQVLYRSQLDAVLSVPGVLAVTGLQVTAPGGAGLLQNAGPPFIWPPGPRRFDGFVGVLELFRLFSPVLADQFVPVEGAFFSLAVPDTNLATAVSTGD
jgi:uncharacterized phage protein gp47/JayE